MLDRPHHLRMGGEDIEDEVRASRSELTANTSVPPHPSLLSRFIALNANRDYFLQ